MNKEVGAKMAKHNKKRNVGLIHEQLVRYASEKIVEGKKKIAENSKIVMIPKGDHAQGRGIIRLHFDPH